MFDAQSASADGSGSASGAFAGDGVATAMRQCVQVAAGGYYNFGGKILMPAGQTTPGNIELFTRWYSNTTCGGTQLGQEDVTPDVVSPAAAIGAWIAVNGSGFAPVGAQSVRLSGAIFKSVGNPLQAKFDELFFQLAPVGNFVLTVTRSGTQSGGVTGAGINCGGGFGNDCTESLAPNAIITLTALPNYYAKFTGWSGGGCSGAAPTSTVTMSAAKNVDAKFDVAPTFTFALIAGTGAGNVTLSTEDASCSSSCNVFIPENKPVTLTATPEAGSVFAGWSGGGCSGTGGCTVTVNAGTAITATFNLAAAGAPIASVPVPALEPALLMLLSSLTAITAWVVRRMAQQHR